MIKPVGNRVLVEPIIQTQEKYGKIFLPETVRTNDASAEAIVVKLGTGKTNKRGVRTAFEVKEGDRVLINRFNGTEIKYGKRILKMVEPNEILAVID